jgi:hypothetical protein
MPGRLVSASAQPLAHRRARGRPRQGNSQRNWKSEYGHHRSAGTVIFGFHGAGMAQLSGTKVRWRTRAVFGSSSVGPSLIQVKKLTGVLVRCPKCGRQACVPYRTFRSIGSAGGCYLKCGSCHEKTFVSDRLVAKLLKDVLPAPDVEDLLPAGPPAGTPEVTLMPEQVEKFNRPASGRATLIALSVILLVVVIAVTLSHAD